MELSSGGLPLGETSPGDYGVRRQTECDAALAYVEEASTWMGFFGRIECGDVTPPCQRKPRNCFRAMSGSMRVNRKRAARSLSLANQFLDFRHSWRSIRRLCLR
jgi:hypothetical protein